MNRIVFTCDICRGEIVFGDGDDPIINTCVCKDNPWRDFRADYEYEHCGAAEKPEKKNETLSTWLDELLESEN